MRLAIIVAILLAGSLALALDYKPVELSDDFLLEQPDSGWCTFRYYYLIDPGYFWCLSGWEPGQRLGMMFGVNDPQIGGQGTQCPNSATYLSHFAFLDFAGYGTAYPGLYTVTFDVYCADRDGCICGPSLWNSGPVETRYGYNWFCVDLPLCGCIAPPDSGPRFVIMTTFIGELATYPALMFDNISTPVQQGLRMHDVSCYPALYPRPWMSYWPVMHTGFYTHSNCPEPIPDPGNDDGQYLPYGCIEGAYLNPYLVCVGPSGAEETSWGRIKSLYR